MKERLEFKVIRIHKLPEKDNGRIRAYVDMGINDQILVKGVRIISGPRGLFVSLPQEKGRNERWYETVRALSREVRQEISKCVLEAYET